MKRQFILVSMVIFAFVITISCKKKKDDPAPGKTKTDLITANNWKVTSSTSSPAMDYDGDGNSSTDLFSQMKDCDKNGFIKFSSTAGVQTGAQHDGCDASNVSNFVWLFNSDETAVTIILGSGSSSSFTTTATLVQLDDNTLKITYTEVQGSTTYTITETYTTDPTPAQAPSHKVALLVANTWKVSGATSSPAIDWDNDGNASTDVYGQMTTCEKNDAISFANSVSNVKTGVYNNCGDGTNNENFTWAFNSAETIVTLTDDGNITDLTITQLTDTALTVTYTQSDSNTNYTITQTFTKK